MKAYNKISFYIVAHQDDWQLFMGTEAVRDLTDPSCKTVIIYTTSGDAGENGKYWSARELAAMNSLSFILSGYTTARRQGGYRCVFAKQIKVVNTGNSASWFLRLPDGGMYGDGFARYSHSSLNKLRSKAITELISVDNINLYTAFEEIAVVVNEIIEQEISKSGITDDARITLNFPETDDLLNPGDHSDHLNTALLVTETAAYRKYRKYAFVHYAIKNDPANLSEDELFWKVGLFSVYHDTVYRIHGHSTIQETAEYLRWSSVQSKFRQIID